MGRHGSPSLNKLPFRQTETVTAARWSGQQFCVHAVPPSALEGFQSNVAVNTLHKSEQVNSPGKAFPAHHLLSAKLCVAARR